MKKSKTKKVTIDSLALMVGKGFAGVDKNFKVVNNKMDSGFEKVNKRLDRIENILLEKHSEEIKMLKDRVKVLEESLAIE